jgi:phage gp16-like protein
MKPNANLAKIHIAKKDLGLSDDAYRDILYHHFKKNSAKDLSSLQQCQLLAIFTAKGWKPAKPSKAGKRPFRASKPTLGRDALIKKIEAHLTERSLPWSYAVGMAKRICKVDAIEFCDETALWKLVAAFEYDSKRKGISQP